MEDRYQLLIDNKAVTDVTIWDIIALAGLLEPRTLYEDKPLSIGCGRFELQRY